VLPVPTDHFPDLPSASTGHALAVLPPHAAAAAAADTHAASGSILVTVPKKGSVANLYSIPGYRHLGRHTLLTTAAEITGLAADPHGHALAIYDSSSHDAHVVPWPLPA
jgi:hypothetical protein